MLDILYRDDCLIAIHKPAGLLVHRTDIDRHETRFAVQLLRDQTGLRVYPVHRLDKGTSGVLLFALDRETAALLGEAFEQQHVDKAYLALVRGYPPLHGDITHPLARRHDVYGKRRTPDSADRQAAKTLYHRLATLELPFAIPPYASSRYALMQLEPLSGRQHQLRRHMKHIAHPIIGDATYGKGLHNRLFAQHYGINRLLLACVHMRLCHPRTQQVLDFHAPLAADFASLVAQLPWRKDEGFEGNIALSSCRLDKSAPPDA